MFVWPSTTLGTSITTITKKKHQKGVSPRNDNTDKSDEGGCSLPHGGLHWNFWKLGSGFPTVYNVRLTTHKMSWEHLRQKKQNDDEGHGQLMDWVSQHALLKPQDNLSHVRTKHPAGGQGLSSSLDPVALSQVAHNTLPLSFDLRKDRSAGTM